MDKDQDEGQDRGQEEVQKKNKKYFFQNRPGTFGICFGIVARVNEGV